MLAAEGECGNKLAIAQGMGVGVKDEVNVLEPNNQHVDVFTGWPSSMGVIAQSRWLGLSAVGALGTILLDDELLSIIQCGVKIRNST